MTTDIATGGNGRLVPHTQPARVGQATAVEQSRAVAEVEAAIVVAMRYPRSVPAAVEAMREACRQSRLAEKAFFRFPRGGQTVSGPSIHLARELARVWGNFQYGTAEMVRDDNRGQSEMLAFAWDVQTNTRNSSTFIVPHMRDKKGGPELLTDMRDIYENNANNGARRVREAIYASLPTWFVEEAKDLCAQTLSDGGGKPLAQRVADAIATFGRIGISQAQMEAKLGQPHVKWIEQDVATLSVIYRSIQRGEISKDEEFPSAADRVTAADIIGTSAAPGTASQRTEEVPGTEAGPESPGTSQPQAPHRTQAGKPALDKLTGLTAQLLGTWPDDEVTALYERVIGHQWNGTRTEVQAVTSLLADALKAAGNDPEAAATSLWAQFHPADGA